MRDKRHMPYKLNETSTRTFYTYHFKDADGKWQGPCLWDEKETKNEAIKKAIMLFGKARLSADAFRVVRHTITETRRVVRIDKAVERYHGNDDK